MNDPANPPTALYYPSVAQLIQMLNQVPDHVQITSIFINPKTGEAWIATTHDGGVQLYKFVNAQFVGIIPGF